MWKPRKYRNKPVCIDGMKFDSIKEGNRYRELILMMAAGEISELEIHPRYPLLESFRDHEGNLIRAVHCTWDFRYVEDGQEVAEDVKSPATQKNPAYILRKKLFMKRYPDIVFKEV